MTKLQEQYERIADLLHDRRVAEINETQRLMEAAEMDRKVAESCARLLTKMRQAVVWTGWEDAARRNKRNG